MFGPSKRKVRMEFACQISALKHVDVCVSDVAAAIIDKNNNVAAKLETI